MAEEIKQEGKKKNKQATKYIFTVILMIFVTCLALYYVLQNDPQTTFEYLGEAKSLYVFIMFLFVFAACGIEGTVLSILAKFYKRKYRVYQGVLNGLIGSFFSAITPFASGGQFVQVYTFSKQGVKPANSASILVMLFIISQTVIVIYGTLAMIFGYNTTIVKMENMNIFGLSVSPIVFSIIGYCMNIFSLLSLLLLAYLRPLHHFILTSGINLLAKLHLVKDPERKRTALAANVATFRIELTRLFKNYWILIVTLVLEFLKFTCFNVLPYFAGCALGANMEGKFFQSLWSNSYLSMITCFIPLPGGSGVSEGGFQLLFKSIYLDPSITSAANILTRSISFYFTLLVGLLVFVFYRGSPKKAVGEYDLKKTYVDLRIISVADSQVQQDVQLEEIDHNLAYVHNETIVDKIRKKAKPHSINKTQARNQALQYYSSDELKESFEDIKKTLILNQTDIYAEEDNQVVQTSKSTLQNVYNEMKDIEVEKDESAKTDTEVKLAIQKDLDALISEEKAKKLRKEKREEKRRLRKERKLKK